MIIAIKIFNIRNLNKNNLITFKSTFKFILLLSPTLLKNMIGNYSIKNFLYYKLNLREFSIPFRIKNFYV